MFYLFFKKKMRHFFTWYYIFLGEFYNIIIIVLYIHIIISFKIKVIFIQYVSMFGFVMSRQYEIFRIFMVFYV